MRSRSLSALAFAAALALAGCSSDVDDDVRANVTILCNHEGALAQAAAEHLQKLGKRAIPTIEAAMHTASVPGRKNLVLALRRIGDLESVPLLAHIALTDGSADVRREAEWTLKGWAADAKSPERAAKSKALLRANEEQRGAEEAG